LVIAIAGCRQPFELPVLDPGSVPAEIREGYPGERDIVWRIYERTETREFAVYTFVEQADQAKEERFHLSAAWFGEDGAILYLAGGSGDLKSFWSTTAGGMAYDPDEQKVYYMDAFGCALDRGVSTIVGITTTGRRVETEVLCGFWALHIQPSEKNEHWVSLTATRDNRSVVHRYQMPQYR
jgi:hypothetical protein